MVKANEIKVSSVLGNALELDSRVSRATRNVFITYLGKHTELKDVRSQYVAKKHSKQVLPFNLDDTKMNDAITANMYFPDLIGMPLWKVASTIVAPVKIAQLPLKDRYTANGLIKKEAKDSLGEIGIILKGKGDSQVFNATSKFKEIAETLTDDLNVIMSQKLSDGWKEPKPSTSEKRVQMVCSTSCDVFEVAKGRMSCTESEIALFQRGFPRCAHCDNKVQSMEMYKADKAKNTSKVEEEIQEILIPLQQVETK